MRTSPGRPWRSILFAAGRGERLRPLTETVAKPVLPLLDVPLGAWGLRALDKIQPTVVNASHLHESVTEAFSGQLGVEFSIEEPEPFGTGGTLAALHDDVAETFVCWNSDMLTDLDVNELWEAHRGSDKLATIAVRSTESAADFVVEDGSVTGLVDRRTSSRPGPQYMGAAVIERQALGFLSNEKPLDLTKGLLQPLIEREQLGVYLHEGYWKDVGTVDRYLRAGLDVLDEKAPPPPIQPPGEIVHIESGRAYIGKDVKVDKTSLGPGAILLAGAQVEKGAYVQDSIVWLNERVPSGERVEDSVWYAGEPIRSLTPGAR